MKQQQKIKNKRCKGDNKYARNPTLQDNDKNNKLKNREGIDGAQRHQTRKKCDVLTNKEE